MKPRSLLLKDRRLYLILNITAGQRPSISRLKPLLKSGIEILQLRCKGLSDRIFLSYAVKLQRICKKNNIIFIINDRPDIASLCAADGVHIGQDDLSPAMARSILGNKKIIGLSTHNIAQLNNAKRDKAIDYIGVGPIFKTDTKPGHRPIGLDIIKWISRKGLATPFFAIGGISLKNLRSLIKAGTRRVALSRAVFNSKDPIATVEKLRHILNDTD